LEHPQFIASTDMNADSPLSVFESDRNTVEVLPVKFAHVAAVGWPAS